MIMPRIKHTGTLLRFPPAVLSRTLKLCPPLSFFLQDQAGGALCHGRLSAPMSLAARIRPDTLIRFQLKSAMAKARRMLIAPWPSMQTTVTETPSHPTIRRTAGYNDRINEVGNNWSGEGLSRPPAER